MAIAYNVIERNPTAGRTVTEITLDATYPAGGYVLDYKQMGILGTPTGVSAEMTAPTGAAHGNLATWDQPAGKLKMYEVGAAGAFDESDAADLSASNKVRLTAFGSVIL